MYLDLLMVWYLFAFFLVWFVLYLFSRSCGLDINLDLEHYRHARLGPGRGPLRLLCAYRVTRADSF